MGRLSVSRKLTLIYLLDLTAVIYISDILVHKKYLAIDFARKEIVGVAYSATVRDFLMVAAKARGPGQSPPQAQLLRFDRQRSEHDTDLSAQTDREAFVRSWRQLAETGAAPPALHKPVIQSAGLDLHRPLTAQALVYWSSHSHQSPDPRSHAKLPPNLPQVWWIRCNNQAQECFA